MALYIMSCNLLSNSQLCSAERTMSRRESRNVSNCLMYVCVSRGVGWVGLCQVRPDQTTDDR
jgi:hypothetical protein